MKFFSTLTAIAALASTALAQLTINSPAAIIQCQPVQLTFSGGRAPYFLAIIPGGQVSATPLVDFGQQTSSPYTWTANIASGTSITIRLSDSDGQFAYSSPITIQAGSSSACLTQSVTGVTTVASTPSSSGAASSAFTTAGVSSTVTGTVTSAASITTTFSTVPVTSTAASTTSTGLGNSVTSAVSSQVSSVSNRLSSIISSIQSQAASVTSTGAAMPTGVAGAGAVFVGALGAVAALL